MRVLDQEDQTKNIGVILTPTQYPPGSQRPNKDMKFRLGCHKLAPLSVINDPRYIKDDIMFFQVIVDKTGLDLP